MQRAKRDGRGSLGFAAEIIFHIMLTFAGQLSASFGGGGGGATMVFPWKKYGRFEVISFAPFALAGRLNNLSIGA